MYNNYIHHNMNPKNKKVGDCAIRAVAAALGCSWDDAYLELATSGLALKCAMNDIEAVEDVLVSNGFSIGKIIATKGSKRPTVAQFAAEHPDMSAVLRVSNHLVTCRQGKYIDIWDSGNKSVYKYWYKQIK